MNLRLTCTQAQYEALTEAAYVGRSKHTAVNRRALVALLLDQARLRKAAERAVDIIEPGGSHELSPKERTLMTRGRE